VIKISLSSKKIVVHFQRFFANYCSGMIFSKLLLGKFVRVLQLSYTFSKFCKMIRHCLSSFQQWSLFIICGYLYQSGYYSYLIKVDLGLGENAKGCFALFNLCLLGCTSLWETLLQKKKLLFKKLVIHFLYIRKHFYENLINLKILKPKI